MKTAGKLHNLNAWERKASHATSLVTPTGITGLDELLPCGGWPKGGVIEVIVPDEHTDAVSLLMPALLRLSRQGRWLAMITPSWQTRARLFTETGLNPVRVLQLNPHPGRSALWTAESMLRSGTCSAVLAWPNCNTELMDRRLQKAAARGRALGILIRYEGFATQPSGVDVRLKLETNTEGSVVYLVNNQGETLSGAALIQPG
jgi:cell division inhibitor SulA/protein ImuA